MLSDLSLVVSFLILPHYFFMFVEVSESTQILNNCQRFDLIQIQKLPNNKELNKSHQLYFSN